MPNLSREKVSHWNTLMGFPNQIIRSGYILDGDFNTTLSQKEKKWGILVHDSSREYMEDLMASLDLIDIKTTKGYFT
jgi:hypothetical protein